MTEYNINLHLVFIDFTEAFDLLNQNFMIQSIVNQGINLDLVKIIQEIYLDLKAQIVTDVEGPHFEIRRGVRQAILSLCFYLTALWKKYLKNCHGKKWV